MIKGIFKESGVLSKILQLIVVLVFVLLSTLLIVGLVTNNDMTNMHNLKIMQLIQSVGMFVVPPLALAFLWSEKPLHYLQLTTKLKLSSILLVVVLMGVAIPFINLITSLNQQIALPDLLAPVEAWMKNSEEQAAVLTEKMLNIHSVNELLFNIFLIAMIPALGEELFFRATIQKILTQWRSAIWGIWIAAFVFSAIHLQFYGFFPRMLLGAFFGYLLVWSGSLWLPIIAHFTNNAIAVIFYYLKYNGYQVVDIDVIGSGETLWLGVVSGVLTIGGIILIKKNLK
ncbi:MAG: CPBP family intramembrane glutamic endopeptidase [Paludibacter sp.]